MYDEYSITTWFNRPLVKPIEYNVNPCKDHFVVIGCSPAYGYQLDSYEDSWASCMSRYINLNHVNLSMPGSSNQWILDRLDHILNSNYNPKFIMVQLTYTNRKVKYPKWLLGDINSRYIKAFNGNELFDVKVIKHILDHYKQHKHIYFTNIWGLDRTAITVLTALAKHYDNFIINPLVIEDICSDNIHPGPSTHKALSHIFKDKFSCK